MNKNGILVLCDARPIVVGHILVTSRSHIPSVLDLPEAERAEMRQVQDNIASFVQLGFGEVGTYEHGRSAICRFGAADGGHTHAHVHVLPIAFDLIRRAGGIGARNPPPLLNKYPNLRYLYQKLLAGGLEQWCVADGAEVPRHFVRTAVQNELARRGATWLPITADIAIHEEAILKTVAAIQGVLRE